MLISGAIPPAIVQQPPMSSPNRLDQAYNIRISCPVQHRYKAVSLPRGWNRPIFSLMRVSQAGKTPEQVQHKVAKGCRSHDAGSECSGLSHGDHDHLETSKRASSLKSRFTGRFKTAGFSSDRVVRISSRTFSILFSSTAIIVNQMLKTSSRR